MGDYDFSLVIPLKGYESGGAIPPLSFVASDFVRTVIGRKLPFLQGAMMAAEMNPCLFNNIAG